MNAKITMIGLGLSVGLSAVASNATWTGAQANGLWCDNGNWTAPYPNGTADVATFSKNATVTQNSGDALSVGCLKVTAGTTAIGATEGSSLKVCKPVAAYECGFVVDTGAKLVVDAPVTSAIRFDKWRAGQFTLRAPLVSTVSSSDTAYGILFDGGSNTVEGAGSVSAPNSGVSIANGEPDNQPVYLVLRDEARLDAPRLWVQISRDRRASVAMEQDGEETQVQVGTGGVVLGYAASSLAEPTTYRLKRGMFETTGTLQVGRDGAGAFVQGGGTSVVSTLLIGNAKTKGEVRLAGGRMSIGTLGFYENGTFKLTGGELDLKNASTSLNLGQRVSLAGRPTLAPSATRTIALRAGLDVAPDTALTVKGAGVVQVKDSLPLDGELTIDGTTFRVAAEASLLPAVNSTTPLKVKVTNGGALRIENIRARIAAPLDLELSSGGKVSFPYGENNSIYARSCVIAHRLVLDGMEQPKGRYQGATDGTYVQGWTGSSIVVPYVWTGAGDGTSWSDGANWADGTVPPNDGTACVDLSRAAGKTVKLEGETKISCLAFLPSGAARMVTVGGTGPLVVDAPASLNTVFFVQDGANVILDVDLKRGTDATPEWMAFVGGGRLTVRRGFPGLSSQMGALDGLRSPFAFDGTIAFSGPNANVQVWRADKYNYPVLSLSCLENAGDARVVVEDGCTLAAQRIFFSPSSFAMVNEFVQEGGTVNLTSLNDLWLTSYINNDARPGGPFYVLKDGTLNAKVNLGRSYKGDRRPGGSFKMNGGTLNTTELRVANAGNNNYFHLTGGQVNLGGPIGSTTDAWGEKEIYRPNSAPPLQLGGVTIHPTIGYASSSLSAELTGINGPTVFDLTVGDFLFGTMTQVKGVGGLVKRGTKTLTFQGTNSFTGTLTVEGGKVLFPVGSQTPELTRLVTTGGTVEIYGNCAAVPDEIDLAAAGDLVLGAGVALSTRRLVVAGVEQTGTVTFGTGTVTVTPSAAGTVWTGATEGRWNEGANWDGGAVPTGPVTVDLSRAGGQRINVDAVGVNVTGIVCNAHGTVTLAAAGGSFAFPANACVTVGEGCTLVLEANATVAGYCCKLGPGRLVVKGRLASAIEPNRLTSDTSFLVVYAGEAEMQGEGAGIRLWSENGGTVVIGEGAVCTNRVTANIWKYTSSRINGRIIQNGGVLDLTDLLPNFKNSSYFGFSLLYGGSGVYELNDGVFRGPAEQTGFGWHNNEGSFVFRQNGGSAVFPNLILGKDAQQNDTYELNAGTLTLGTSINHGTGTYALILNGGRVETTTSGRLFPMTHAAQLGGRVTFATRTGVEAVIPCDLAGAGELVHEGPGTLHVASMLSGASRIEQTGGTLILDAPVAATNVVVAAGGLEVTYGDRVFLDSSELNLAEGASVDLDFIGEVTVGRLRYRGNEVAAGVYGVSTGRTVHGAISGTGTLRVLNGVAQGTMVIVR